MERRSRRHANGKLAARVIVTVIATGAALLTGPAGARAEVRAHSAQACSLAPVMVIEARTVKRRVAVDGLANVALAGQPATVTAMRGSKPLGRAVRTTVGRDGRFTASLPLPARAQRARVTYRASVAGKRSQAVSLARTVIVTSRRTTAAGTTVSGRISAGRWKLDVTRQRCGGTDRVRRLTTDKKGRFRVLLPKPAATDAVTVFRARGTLGRKRTANEIILAVVQPGTRDEPAPGPVTPPPSSVPSDSAPPTVAGTGPAGAGDVLRTAEDTPVTVSSAELLANDVSVPGRPLAITRVDAGPRTHGTVTLTGEQVRYVPAADFNGSASFTYTAVDALGNTVSAAVDVTVSEVNDPPVAGPDARAVSGSVLSIPAASLTANDRPGPSDEHDQTLTVTKVTASEATHGQVQFVLGIVTFTADPGFVGEARFTYSVCDDGTTAGALDPRCDEGVVTVDVAPPPWAPTATDLSIATDEDEPEAMTLSAIVESGAPLTYSIVALPEHGTLSPAGTGGAARTYQPDPDFYGTDRFTYRASDGVTNSNLATVTISVRPINDPPLAVSDAKRTTPGTALTFPAADLLANDRPGPDNESGQTLTVTSVSAGEHGAATLAGTQVTFTPDSGFTGAATFSYRVCDDDPVPLCADGTVHVTVEAVAVTALAISPGTPSIADGETVRFRATATFSDGSSRELDDVDWSSSTPAVANITPDGVARGGTAGTTTIVAAKGEVRAEATLTVIAAELAEIVVEPASQNLLVGQTQTLRATGVLTDGRSENLAGQVVWSTSASGIATVAASGIVTATGPGTATIRATRGAVSGTATVTVEAVASTDSVAPVATITSPGDDAEITEPTDIVGTATDDNFLKYTLQIAPAGETQFTTIEERSTPVTAGVLGRLDPTVLRNDLYSVRLTVHDRGGNVTSRTVVVQVARDQKVGNYTLAFTDLEVPLSGLPIAVNRVYDSRDKRQGDFGVGWRLDVRLLQLRATPELSGGWAVDRAGSPVSTYTLRATRAHKVSVTLPDGKVEEFNLVPSPTSSVLLPFQFIGASFQPRPGTYGSLRVAGGNPGIYVNGTQPGAVTLLNEDTLAPYDPRTFEYTAPNGNVFVLTAAGVQSMRDPNGNTLTFGTNGITHSSGVAVAFARDAQGRITQITDPMGNVNRYTYDANGDLESHTDPAESKTLFSYDRGHRLIEIHDPRGVQATRNEYDDDGRLVATIDPAGNRTTVEHDLDGRQEIVRDRRGYVSVHEYDEDGNIVKQTDPLGGITRRTFNARGNELTLTDPLGNTTTREYDARGNVTKEIDPTGAAVTRTLNARSQPLTETDANGRTTTFVYDAGGNLLSQSAPGAGTVASTFDARGLRTSTTDAAGGVFAYTYSPTGMTTSQTDPTGHRSEFTHDANGNRTRTEEARTGPDGASEPVVTTAAFDGKGRIVQLDDGVSRTTTEYDATGLDAATIDGRGARTSRDYDALGRLTRTTYPDRTFEAFSYDDGGNRVASQDRAGRTTTYGYDALNRVTRVTRPDGTTLLTSYDAAGRVASKTDARGNVTRFEHDGAGRVVRQEGPDGAVTTYAYDAKGNRTRMTDPRGKVTTYEHDAADRLVKTTFADGTTRTTTYDAAGRRSAESDEAGAQTSFAYNELGWLTRVTDALGGETGYAYDEVGNMVAVSDARSNVTRFAYDDGGRTVSRTLPLGQSESFVYDANGNAVAHTSFNGVTTLSEYDAMDRLTREVRPEGETTYTYTAAGLPATVRDPSGEVRSTYDALDRLARTENPDGMWVEYGYDAAGNRTSMRTAHGTIGYEHDASGRLLEVTDTAGRTTEYGYDASGNRTSRLLPNGGRATYTYDDRDRVTSIRHLSGGGTVLAAYDYTYDAAGRRVAAAETGDREIAYGYDALGRLTTESVTDAARGDRSTTYIYDVVGNRLSTTTVGATTTYTYDANDRLLTAGANQYEHDANGNVVRHGPAAAPVTLTYDSANRLVATGGAAPAATFHYDAAGNRVGVASGGKITRYLLDTNTPLPQVLEEHADGGSPAVQHVLGNGLISSARGAAVSYHHADALQSVRLLSDEAGAVTDTYDYDAFGNSTATTGSTPNDFRFAGEQYEPELGTYNLRARHYDPAVGRFVSLDPTVLGDLREPRTLHEYAYADDDPVNRIDPTGHTAISAVLGSPAFHWDAANTARLMAVLAKVKELVIPIAVTACGLRAATSYLTFLPSCNITKHNFLFVSRLIMPETAEHISDAIVRSRGQWATLHRGTNSVTHLSSRWYRRAAYKDQYTEQCSDAVNGRWCDEYPFHSTVEGGPPGASLRDVPATEQRIQGGQLSAFYTMCRVTRNDPIAGAFGVVVSPFPPTPPWICR